MSSFFAFGFRSDSSVQLADWIADVTADIEALNCKAVIDNFLVDLEVSPGLYSFCEHKQLDRLLYIDTEKRRKIGPNSQEVFYELAIAAYADSGEIQLVNLLLDAATTYPGAELYLFFAFEWEAHSFSRFTTIQKADLQGLLNRYDSHYRTLFNSYTGHLVLDLDTPTVICIT